MSFSLFLLHQGMISKERSAECANLYRLGGLSGLFARFLCEGLIPWINSWISSRKFSYVTRIYIIRILMVHSTMDIYQYQFNIWLTYSIHVSVTQFIIFVISDFEDQTTPLFRDNLPCLVGPVSHMILPYDHPSVSAAQLPPFQVPPWKILRRHN